MRVIGRLLGRAWKRTAGALSRRERRVLFAAPVALGLAVTALGAAVSQSPKIAGTETGFAVFQTHCMGCHGNPDVPRAPQPSAIRQMTPERIYAALTTGPMKAQGDTLTDDQRRMLAVFMSGRPFGTIANGAAKDMPNRCPSNPAMAPPSPQRDWIGWGASLDNARYRAESGLKSSDIPHLTFKWAFGFPGGLSAYGQPTVVDGRVFVGADTGWVYALDARAGCVYWSFLAKGAVRSAPTVGLVHGRLAVFFGDFHANVYGLDARTGKELWTSHVDKHFVARITAGPAFYHGRLFVPVSSSEEFSAATLDYPCCTSRGSVVALDASTGRRIWKAWVVGTPKPIRKNSKGVQLYAPAGGSVWSSPTVDPARHAIYFGTGDSETEPAPNTTDAVMAVDMGTGRRLWVHQLRANDSFLGGCTGPARTENCPKDLGPDLDIGNSPILQVLPGGRRIVVVGTKDGEVFALDPDRDGKLVWETHVLPANAGGRTGSAGIYWGGAADGKRVYYGLAAGAVAAVGLNEGQHLWTTPLSAHGSSNGAAVSAIPGVAFIGGMDGKLHAVSTADGRELWSFDTARTFATTNQVPAHGGGIGSNGVAVADGMVFVSSGYAVVGDRSGNVLLAFAPD